MQSDGPYTTGDSDGLVFLNGRGVENFDSRRDAMNAASLANAAYSEGRKAAEKEFKGLLELAEYVVDRIGDSGPFGQMHALEKFRAWKKARGIV